MKKFINKILLKIMNKFNIPRMEISDKEYEKGLKKFIDNVGTEKGKPFVVPNKNTKKIIKSLFKSEVE